MVRRLTSYDHVPGRNVATLLSRWLTQTRLCHAFELVWRSLSHYTTYFIDGIAAAGRLGFGWASQQAEAFASSGTYAAPTATAAS